MDSAVRSSKRERNMNKQHQEESADIEVESHFFPLGQSREYAILNCWDGSGDRLLVRRAGRGSASPWENMNMMVNGEFASAEFPVAKGETTEQAYGRFCAAYDAANSVKRESWDYTE